MKYLAGLFTGLLLVSTCWAQEVDEQRMDRDISIAEDIISGLLTQGGQTKSYFGKSKVSGNYINDFGVIFNIPLKSGWWPMSINVYGDDGKIIITDKDKTYEYKLDEDHVAGDYQEILEKGEDYIQDVMVSYLVDYADLIGQLKPTDKIMLKSESKGSVFVVGGSGYSFKWKSSDDEDEDEYEEDDECCDDFGGGYVLSAEVTKSDLSAYKSGKIDRDALIDRIQIEKTASVSETEPELELLSTIFRRLYRSDLSNTYFATRDPDYDRITKFGVIYKWRVYSSNVDGDKHNMPTVDLYDLTSEDRNRKVEELYPMFLDQFRKNMVEYGRTLKGLDSDDILMFKIRMTECEGCTIPKSIDLSVKRSVLDDYEKQKIDLNTAAQRVSLNEHMTD